MFDVFGWLRRKAHDAVLGGIADAVAKVAAQGETPPADLDGLRAMLATADVKTIAAATSEPAATTEEPTAKPRKATTK
jgi:hypothetical protein